MKKLILTFCKNLILLEETCLNLIKLEIMYCEISTLNKLLKFPNLEEIKISDSINENEHKYNSLIDFKSLNKLKIFNVA